MNILELKNVIKSFGEYKATNDVSFSVPKGSIFGLLGPNGAGKTTIIRQITNIYVPDQGSITMFDQEVGPEHQNRIGYLPEERGLYKKVKVIDQLVYFGRLKGLSSKDAEARARQWLIKLEAADWAEKKIQELSKGMQQKVQFISTILHDPEFLILDEPFSGFDPVNVETIKKIIFELREKGITIILSTHVMAQVEELCDEIVLINKGKIVLNGGVREIKRSFGKNQLSIEFEGGNEFLKGIENIELLSETNNRCEIKLLNGETQTQEVLKALVDNNNLVMKFEISEPSLHEIFIETVGAANLNEEEIAQISQ